MNGVLRGRRGARLTALTSGGAIPDTADYDVVLEPAGQLVGTVNEDFAVESLAGDIFQLGNTSYRIQRIESGRVRVEDAHGQPPTIPFWLGEAPGRTDELSHAVSRLRSEVVSFLDAGGDAGAMVLRLSTEGRHRAGSGGATGRVSRQRSFCARHTAYAGEDRPRAVFRRIRRACSWSSTRRSAAASTARGAWHCASAFA